jgi:hypothetical protein
MFHVADLMFAHLLTLYLTVLYFVMMSNTIYGYTNNLRGGGASEAGHDFYVNSGGAM